MFDFMMLIAIIVGLGFVGYGKKQALGAGIGILIIPLICIILQILQALIF